MSRQGGIWPPGHKVLEYLRRGLISAIPTALVLLASLAFAWPPAWQPGDKAYEIVQRGTFPTGSEEVAVEIRLYEDGVSVFVVNDRPFAVDRKPNELCAPLWEDMGMLREGLQPNSGAEIPPSQWRAPDWREVPSQHPDCKGE